MFLLLLVSLGVPAVSPNTHLHSSPHSRHHSSNKTNLLVNEVNWYHVLFERERERDYNKMRERLKQNHTENKVLLS